MKDKLFYPMAILAVALTAVLHSCENGNQKLNDSTALFARGTEPLIVGSFDSTGNFTFDVDKALLLENWNYNLLKLNDIDAKLEELDIFKEDGRYFIKARGLNWASTVELELTGRFQAYGGGISCTSNHCSDSSTECVPKADKKSCTKCGFRNADCTKTVTARAIFDIKTD